MPKRKVVLHPCKDFRVKIIRVHFSLGKVLKIEKKQKQFLSSPDFA